MKRPLTLFLSTLIITLTGCSSDNSSSEINEQGISQITLENENSDLTFLSPIITSGQTNTYDEDGNIIETNIDDPLYGQDGDYNSLEFSFTLNSDGTTTDNNTGLMWETVPMGGKSSWEDAINYCNELELGGYDDWRIPTVEELFSISDFSVGWPYLDTGYFSFDESNDSSMMPPQMDEDGGPQGGGPQGGLPQGEESQGLINENNSENSELSEMPPMEIPNSSDYISLGGVSKDDGQYWTSSHNMVEGDERLGDIAFGVNHSTGHIKAYPSDSTPMMGKYVRAVRGNVYGDENYTNNNDGTVTDNESGLMWLQDDLGYGMDWAEALSSAENFEFAGYDDWRLPDVKELQSIVDYGGSYPAINQDYFNCSILEENENYYYWTSTSAYFSEISPNYDSAWYVAFGYTSHGAGAVRFSPKYVGSEALSEGEDNILNSVRLVRNVN
ncbi:MAG: DUF1566 domain-containing protein [Peptostreptococcaceae bacterium]